MAYLLGYSGGYSDTPNIRASELVRFYRINGRLAVAPVRRSTKIGFRGADRVSDLVEVDQGGLNPQFELDMAAAMGVLADVWAAHSGSSAATLKTEIHKALQNAGFRRPDGSNLT